MYEVGINLQIRVGYTQIPIIYLFSINNVKYNYYPLFLIK